MKSYLFENYLFGFSIKTNVFCLITELLIRLKLKKQSKLSKILKLQYYTFINFIGYPKNQ
jgi:hypothetical protein